MLASCTTQNLADYAHNRPLLQPEQFFQGQLTAQGVVKNRSGQVIRYFTASINAHWHQGVGQLDEKFLFNDGEIQTRVWTLSPLGISQPITTDSTAKADTSAKIDSSVKTYVARAGDVIGDGKARVAGNSMNLNYQLQIDYQHKPLVLNVDDWMWLVDEDTIINESVLRKWGIKVGSIQLVIRRLPPHSPAL